MASCEVFEGFGTGELAVTSGAGFLSDGDRVRVVAALALARTDRSRRAMRSRPEPRRR